MADKDQGTKEETRNEGKGVSDYNEKKPNVQDIHSDDPLVAGLANGKRQMTNEEPDSATVK